MSDKPPMMPPQSEPFPGSRTPGWNDPPTLQYNPLGASGSSGRPRLNLNKRVAFPLQGNVAAGSSPKPTAVVQPNQTTTYMPPPPIPVGTAPMLPTNLAGSLPSSHPVAVVHPTLMTGFIPLEVQQQVLQTLRNQVRLVHEDVLNKREEIERRLDIIGQLWQTGVLSNEVQSKLCSLGKAISEQNYRAAMEAYTTLATNYSNECASWVVALRHLVLTIESASFMNAEPSNPQAPTLFVPAVPRNTTEQMETSEPTLFNPIQHI